MRSSLLGSLVFCAFGAVACSPSETRCPAEFPIERAGFCYGADGGSDALSVDASTLPDSSGTDVAPRMDAGGGADTGSGTDTGNGTDSGAVTDSGRTTDSGTGADAGGGTDTGGTDAGAICRGSHPVVMGTRRTCNAGDCYCATPENCFPAETAAACCSVPVVCASSDGGTSDAGAICRGSHPIVVGTRRTCNAGDCYCATPENCFPAETAAACCPAPVVCAGSDAGTVDAGTADAGVICRGSHPIVMGSRRYCDPGNCFCASPDSCFPTDTARACCPGAVTCY